LRDHGIEKSSLFLQEQAMLLSVNPFNPELRKIRQVVEALRRGGVIGYPTDTIYGIGCSIFQKGGIQLIYEIKGKDRHKPLSFICSDLKDISQYAQVSNYAYKTMKRLLPGPYTFILQATRLVPKIMLTKRKTVGIRIPDNTICLALVRELGHPIITTSVSKPDEQLYNDPQEIHDRLKGRLDMVIDGGIMAAVHSTIVDLTEETPEILRIGRGDVSYFSAQRETAEEAT
jgi:tRNA threonylcarbamoyl adenosine modification protein (Sua5/YciO/YrdC/YwlC family)